jgi:hypothetical protein
MTNNIDSAGNNFCADSEQRIKFRKRLYELSLKSLGEIPILDELNDEQLSWSENKMSPRRWRR